MLIVVGADLPKLEFSGLRVLVIDDSSDTTEMLRQLLQMNGAQVRTAGSGAEGLEVLSQQQFDVIISDVAMPERTGSNFCVNYEHDQNIARCRFWR